MSRKIKFEYVFTAMLILIVIGFIGYIGSQFSEHKKIEENMRQDRVKRQEEIKMQEREKPQREKKAFEESIENHYAELIKLFDQKQFDDALGKVRLFQRFMRTDYKDVMKYYKTIYQAKWKMGDKSSSSYSQSGTSSFSQPNASKQWFEGGNLHKANCAQWKRATYQNKLATAADWLTAVKWKGHLNSNDDFDKLKVKAQMLVNGIDIALNVDKEGNLDSENVAAMAMLFFITTNDLDP